MNGIVLYIASLIVGYGLVQGLLSARFPYMNSTAFSLLVSLLGPVTIVAAIWESLAEVHRLHFRLFPRTPAERFVEFCNIYGFDYKDYELFRQEYP